MPPLSHDDRDARVRQYADLVYRTALRIVGGTDDAADVTQEALVRIWQKGDAVPAAKLRAWCARVARNAALDHLRRGSVRPHTWERDTPMPDGDLHAPSPADDAEQADLRRHLDRAIAALDEPYRSIVVLREIEGLSYAEVSDALDLPLNTMKVYLHRARRRLRLGLRATLPALP